MTVSSLEGERCLCEEVVGVEGKSEKERDHQQRKKDDKERTEDNGGKRRCQIQREKTS